MKRLAPIGFPDAKSETKHYPYLWFHISIMRPNQLLECVAQPQQDPSLTEIER